MRISDWSSDVCSSDLLNVSSIIECDIPGTTDILVPHYSVWEFLSLRKFYFRTNSPQPAIESAFRKEEAKPCDALSSTRSEDHTSELQSLMRISYAVFCLKKKIYKSKSPSLHAFYNPHKYI